MVNKMTGSNVFIQFSASTSLKTHVFFRPDTLQVNKKGKQFKPFPQYLNWKDLSKESSL